MRLGSFEVGLRWRRKALFFEKALVIFPLMVYNKYNK